VVLTIMTWQILWWVIHMWMGRLTNDEKSMLVDMTKTLVKLRNILLTLKEHNEKNVTTIKQVYNAMNTYRKTEQDHKTKMQHLMMLLERDMYPHWCRFNEGTNVVQDFFWTHLLNSFYIVLMMDNTYKMTQVQASII